MRRRGVSSDGVEQRIGAAGIGASGCRALLEVLFFEIYPPLPPNSSAARTMAARSSTFSFLSSTPNCE